MCSSIIFFRTREFRALLYLGAPSIIWARRRNPVESTILYYSLYNILASHQKSAKGKMSVRYRGERAGLDKRTWSISFLWNINIIKLTTIRVQALYRFQITSLYTAHESKCYFNLAICVCVRVRQRFLYLKCCCCLMRISHPVTVIRHSWPFLIHISIPAPHPCLVGCWTNPCIHIVI